MECPSLPRHVDHQGALPYKRLVHSGNWDNSGRYLNIHVYRRRFSTTSNLNRTTVPLIANLSCWGLFLPYAHRQPDFGFLLEPKNGPAKARANSRIARMICIAQMRLQECWTAATPPFRLFTPNSARERGNHLSCKHSLCAQTRRKEYFLTAPSSVCFS